MNKLIIIDKVDISSTHLNKKNLVLFWNNYDDIELVNCFSILNIVEENADFLKKIYLNWINNIGEIKVKSLPLYQKLKIRNIYSYWWQTIFIEKSNYENSSQINDSIKLIALQQWLKNIKIKEINLISNNKKLGECLKDFSKKKGLIFKFVSYYDGSFRRFTYKSLKKVIPSKILALIWLLRKIKYSFPLSRISRQQYIDCKPDIIFVDYLVNFEEKALLKGEFQSNYWGKLINKINEKELKTLWIHLPINLDKNSSYLKSTEKVNQKFKEFYQNSNKLQTHLILDSFLNFDVIKKSFYDWLRILKIEKEINLDTKIPLIEELNLWPLYKNEWSDSFYGVKGISNCINFNLFDSVFELNKSDSKLIYLLENNTWEFAMIESWKNKCVGEIIGYIHSCIPYWDMRKYFDSKTFSNPFFPSPDKYGLNGDLSKNNFEFNDIKEEKILKLEATRYLYLNDLKKDYQKFSTKKNDLKTNILLVICDYTDSYTEKQLKLLSNIKENLDPNFIIKIKPHPAKVKTFLKKYGNKFQIINEPIAKIAKKADVILTSSTTTTSLEFYHIGNPVISILDDKALSLSPLRNKNHVNFVSNSNQLLDILNNYKFKYTIRQESENIFYLNNELVNWLNLLKNENYK